MSLNLKSSPLDEGSLGGERAPPRGPPQAKRSKPLVLDSGGEEEPRPFPKGRRRDRKVEMSYIHRKFRLLCITLKSNCQLFFFFFEVRFRSFLTTQVWE